MWDDDEPPPPQEELGGGDGAADTGLSPLLTSSDGLPPGAAAVLPGPGGTAVVLVGVAHVDQASAADATSAIQATMPAAVVLELDPARLAALEKRAATGEGDRYGIGRYAALSRSALALKAASGEGPAMMLGLAYAVGGALLGAPAGGEFLAAKAAAESAGAAIILGDRDQRVTLARLSSRASAAAREAAAAGPGAGGGAGPSTGDWTRPGPGATGGAGGGLRPGDAPVFTGGGGAGPGADPAPARAPGVDPSPAPNDPSAPQPAIGDGADPWGLASPAAARARRWKGFLEAGGCANADAAVSAFRRILERGLAKGAAAADPASAIDDADLAAVRRCGRAVVSHTRAAALADGSAALKNLEAAAVATAASSAGPGAGPAASHLMAVAADVLGAERDVVLGRALWDAAAAAPPGSAVVGVVGAGHVRGIQAAWGPAAIGSPASAALAASLRGDRRVSGGGRRPPSAGPSPSVLPAVMTAGLLAMLAARRPRAALFIVGSTVALTAPLAWAAGGVMARYERLALAVGAAAERVDAAGPEVGDY